MSSGTMHLQRHSMDKIQKLQEKFSHIDGPSVKHPNVQDTAFIKEAQQEETEGKHFREKSS